MRVVGLGSAPVKGGRQLFASRVRIGEHGVDDDRRLGVLVEGSILRTVAHPEVLAARFERVGERLTVELPDGSRAEQGPAPGASLDADYWGRSVPVETWPGEVSEAVSGLVGRRAAIARVVSGAGLIYGAPVSLAFASRLERLGLAAEEWKRFRWNVLVDDRDAPVDERSLTGRLIRLGDVRLRVVELLDRCGVIDRNPSTGERDRAVYSALPVADGRRTMGVGARVEAGGEVALGSSALIV